MKTARWILCIVALSAVIIGCGEETPDFVGVHDDADPHDLSAYYHWWDIAVINGKKMNIRRGSVYFSGSGVFTHVFTAYQHIRTSPDTSIVVGYAYTNRGRYTTHRNRLTITESSTQRDVDARLDPDVRQTQKEGRMLKALKADFRSGHRKRVSTVNFQCWNRIHVADRKTGTLILSSPKQWIVLKRQDRLDELETSSAWW